MVQEWKVREARAGQRSLHREGRQLFRRLPARSHRPQRLGAQPDEASDGEGGYHVSPTNLHLSGIVKDSFFFWFEEPLNYPF